MRIGLLSTSYPRHPRDPAGRFVAELAAWLADTGDALEVLAPHPACAQHPGVNVVALRYALRPRLLYGSGAPDNLRHLGARVQIPAFVARLALSCIRRSRRWDRVISHRILPCGLVASQASRGKPHLAIAHSSDVHLLAQLPGASLWLDALSRPRTRLALTSESLRPILRRVARSAMARRLVDDATVIRMGIRAHRLCSDDNLDDHARRSRHPLRRRLDLSRCTLVLFVGRLVPVKGVDLLIRACAGLSDMALVVVGDGPERVALERLSARLQARVLFVGQLGDAERDAWLQAADLLACPSVRLPDGRTDSAPVVLLEAMAAGLPVVASRVGGNAELIQHGENGLLVPPGEVGALVDALLRLRSSARLRHRLGRQALRCAEQHTWDRLGPRLRDLLQRL